ncbi:DUF4230 domain-containing protein [Leptothoe sp. ISB3NOV94-8A]
MSAGSSTVSLRNVLEDFVSNTISVGLIVAAALAAIWFIVHAVLTNPFSIDTTEEVRDVLVGTIQAESTLITASQDITANVAIDKTEKFLIVPIGETSLVYAAVGESQAGIDLEKIEVLDFDAKKRTVKLLLPPANIDINLNVERSETLANYRQWFGHKAGATIYEEAQQEAYAEMWHKACSQDILNAAVHNAEVQVRTILKKVGFKQVEFKVSDSTACPAK